MGIIDVFACEHTGEDVTEYITACIDPAKTERSSNNDCIAMSMRVAAVT